jgi:hypothetical protein
MIDRQRDTIIKVKKDCRFEYTLFYKAVNRGNDEKGYIKTLKCLKYTHLIVTSLAGLLSQGSLAKGV